MSDKRARILAKRGEALRAMHQIDESVNESISESLYPVARVNNDDVPLDQFVGITTRSKRRQASVDVKPQSNPSVNHHEARISHSSQPSISINPQSTSQSFTQSNRSNEASRSNSVSRMDDDAWMPSSKSPLINQSSNQSSSQSRNQSRTVPLSPIDSPEPGAADDYSDDSDFELVEPGAKLPVAQPINHINQPSDMFRNPFFEDSEQSSSQPNNRSISRSRSIGVSRMTMSKSFDSRSLPARVIGRATMSFAAELSSLEEHPAIQQFIALCDSLPFISTLSAKLHMSSLYVMLLVCFAALLMSLNMLGLTQFINMFTLIYPCYMSYHTLEDEDGHGEHSNTRFWLMYWCVYGACRCVTFVTDRMFQSSIYVLTKLLFTIWCCHPSTRGCVHVFTYFMWPLYRANRKAIEHITDSLTCFIGDVIDECRGVMKAAVVGAIAGNDRPRKARIASQSQQM